MHVVECHMRRAISRWKWPVLATVLGIALIAALSWRTLMFGIAVASSETMPALLSDAEWDDPASTTQFNRRFGSGVAESELVAWLHANKFVVNARDRSAERVVQSLPCNERVEVQWTALGGRLKDANATVYEAGCL
jgi:hypothetical protein